MNTDPNYVRYRGVTSGGAGGADAPPVLKLGGRRPPSFAVYCPPSAPPKGFHVGLIIIFELK